MSFILYSQQVQQSLLLSTNSRMPLMGFGTWQLRGNECKSAVENALLIGYRHIDTAGMYGNHKEVAEGIQSSGVKREEIFLTTKVWWAGLGHDEVLKSVHRFLQELHTDYIDLLLIHWPNPMIPVAITLATMQQLVDDGVILSYGVANFTIELLQEIENNKKHVSVNQVEFHPSLYQKELKSYCDEHNIALTAYSPIAQGDDLELPIIMELAKKYGKTPAQIVLNWIMKKKIAVIPRSSKKSRIQENFDALLFELSTQDSAAIDALSLHHRIVHPSFAPFKD